MSSVPSNLFIFAHSRWMRAYGQYFWAKCQTRPTFFQFSGAPLCQSKCIQCWCTHQWHFVCIQAFIVHIAKTLLSPPNFIFHCMQFWHIFFSFFLFLHSVYLCTFSMPINFIAQYIYIEWCFCSYFVPTVIFIIETAAPQEMHWCCLKRNRCMPPLELYIPYNSGCVFKFVRLRECRKKIYKPHKFINICTTKNTTWERQRKKCWE